MIFISIIRFYLHFITLYACKNKHIFPNFQTFSGNYANCERLFLYFCTIREEIHRQLSNIRQKWLYYALFVVNVWRIGILYVFLHKISLII